MRSRAVHWLAVFGIAASVLARATAVEAANLLQLVDVIENPGFDMNVHVDNIYGIAISPDGKNVYFGEGYGSTGVIIVMSRDPATGQLTFVENVAIDEFFFFDFVNVAVSPDGKNVYATSWEGGFIAAYARDPDTGVLTPVLPDLIDNDNAWDMDFTPDGTRLYLTGDNAVLYVYDRNPTTGALTQISTTDLDAVSGVSVDVTPVGTSMSPDGQNIYFASYADRDLLTFHLFPDGSVDFLGIFGYGYDDEGPFYDAHGLAVGGSGVVVSLDGKTVYVSAEGTGSGGVGVFDRDATTGLLTVADVAPGHNSTAYLDTLALQPDGRWIYASGDPLTLYHRDGGTGRLTRVEEHHDVVVGQIRISPDGANVYVAESESDFVAVYRFMGCAQVPATGCRQEMLPRKGSLVLKNDPDDAKDVAVWKWASGAATAFADFDDPGNTTDYSFCVYDQSGPGGTPRLLVAATAPPGGMCRTKPCWKLVSNTKLGIDLGFNFTDALRANDGLNKITLRQGIAGKANLAAKVGGVKLGNPTLPLTGTVTAQLRASANGTCWSATYSMPTLNTATTYRAKGD